MSSCDEQYCERHSTQDPQTGRISNFIRCVADDALGDLRERGKYRDVTLLMTGLICLDAILELHDALSSQLSLALCALYQQSG